MQLKLGKIKKQHLGIWVALMGGLMVILAAALVQPAAALSEVPRSPDNTVNDTCLGCHEQPGMQMVLAGGEILSLTIDGERYAASVHNERACTDCHEGYKLPHPELDAQTVRQASLEMYTSCQKCHQEQYDQTLDSVHQVALAGGNMDAAICTDCHNPHTQTSITDELGYILPEARLRIPATCARCHSAIYDEYEASVHGSALTEENNPDVPTCIDCHGVHAIEDPSTTAFKLESPTEMCGRCHTDPNLMAPYGISTDVLDTYVADFHGTTIILFESAAPDQPINKPVCFDCHGVHDIKATDDPEKGLHVRENLLAACQRCHTEATENFPDAWLSHYVPDQNKYPIVYYVDLFYKIFIPGVLGVMGVFVATDVFRRMVDRRKGKS